MTLMLRDIGYFTSILLVTVVGCPFCIYCWLLLQKHWKSRCFEQRRPIVVASLLFLIQAVSLVKIYIDFVQYWVYNSAHTKIFDIFGLAYIPLTYFCLGFYNIRFWLLYYDGQVSHAIKNHSWRMAIDPNSESKNKYLDPNFQRIFGNDRYLIVMAVCSSIVSTSIADVAWFMIAQHWGIIVWVVICCLHFGLAGTSWISFKRKLNNYDYFGIRKEIEMTLNIGTVFFITYVIAFTSILYIATEEEYSWIENIQFFVFCILLQYIAVPYVIKLQNNAKTIGSVKLKLIKSMQNVNDKDNRDNNHINIHSTSSTQQNSTPRISTPRGSNEVMDFNFNFQHWSQVVSSAYGYELFINHLEQEYSVENLLFLTEYVQVKTVLEYKFEILSQLISNNKRDMGFDVKMPKISQSLLNESGDDQFDLPLSKIAIKLYHDKNVRIAFKSLYNKYINGTNAPFMINIGSRQRNSLMELFDCRYYQKVVLAQTNNVNSKIALIDDQFVENNQSMEWLLKCIITQMDVAANEITQLINDSFRRFKHQIS